MIWPIAWGLWFCLVVAAETALSRGVEWLFIPAGVAFCALEGYAIYLPRRGDTLSEQVWRIIRGGRARIPLVAGFTIWLMARGWLIIADAPYTSWPVLALMGGGLGWLLLHFLLQGRDG